MLYDLVQDVYVLGNILLLEFIFVETSSEQYYLSNFTLGPIDALASWFYIVLQAHFQYCAHTYHNKICMYLIA